MLQVLVYQCSPHRCLSIPYPSFHLPIPRIGAGADVGLGLDAESHRICGRPCSRPRWDCCLLLGLVLLAYVMLIPMMVLSLLLLIVAVASNVLLLYLTLRY